MTDRTRAGFGLWMDDVFGEELGEGLIVDANSAAVAGRTIARKLVEDGWAVSNDGGHGALADWLRVRILAEYPEGSRLDAEKLAEGSVNVATALIEQGWVLVG